MVEPLDPNMLQLQGIISLANGKRLVSDPNMTGEFNRLIDQCQLAFASKNKEKFKQLISELSNVVNDYKTPVERSLNAAIKSKYEEHHQHIQNIKSWEKGEVMPLKLLAEGDFELPSSKQGLHYLYSLMDHARRKVLPRASGSRLELKGKLIEEFCHENSLDLAKTEIVVVAKFLINCDNPITDRAEAKQALQEIIRKSKNQA